MCDDGGPRVNVAGPFFFGHDSASATRDIRDPLRPKGGGQPYGALVAFAFSPDLRHACFATPMATRKYRLLSECDHVALVVDSRSSASGGLMGIEAFTATGRASRMERGPGFDAARRG